MACRDVDQGQTIKDGLLGELPLAKLTVVKLDLANLESIRTFAQRIQAAELTPDLLINNAGIYRVPKRQETEDGFELQFGVNHLGHFALTGLLLPGMLQRPDSRVVTVTSILHRRSRGIRFDDLHSCDRYTPGIAYSNSKLANVLFTLELQRRMERTGAATISTGAHPGAVDTGLHSSGPQLGRFSLWNALVRTGTLTFAQSSGKGALPILRAAVDPDARGGEIYGPDGPFELRGHSAEVAKVSSIARDHELAARLWAESERITSVTFPV